MPEGRRRRVTGTGRGLAPLGWLVLALGLALPTGAQPVGDAFHAGKSMRFVVGFTAGGGFDTTTRLLARHMGRHIPGHPAIVVENMPGAGSLIAANHLYRVAQPDGLTVGQFAGSVLLGQVLGHPGVESRDPARPGEAAHDEAAGDGAEIGEPPRVELDPWMT